MSLFLTIIFFTLSFVVLIYGIMKNKKVLFPVITLFTLGLGSFFYFTMDILDFDDDTVFERELELDD